MDARKMAFQATGNVQVSGAADAMTPCYNRPFANFEAVSAFRMGLSANSEAAYLLYRPQSDSPSKDYGVIARHTCLKVCKKTSSSSIICLRVCRKPVIGGHSTPVERPKSSVTQKTAGRSLPVWLRPAEVSWSWQRSSSPARPPCAHYATAVAGRRTITTRAWCRRADGRPAAGPAGTGTSQRASRRSRRPDPACCPGAGSHP